MSANKKPRSKPAAKKKAVRILAPFTPGPDSQLIASIAVRVRELARELKSVHQKLDFVVVTLDTRRDKSEEPHPVVRAAIQAMEGDGEGNQQ